MAMIVINNNSHVFCLVITESIRPIPSNTAIHAVSRMVYFVVTTLIAQNVMAKIKKNL